MYLKTSAEQVLVLRVLLVYWILHHNILFAKLTLFIPQAKIHSVK